MILTAAVVDLTPVVGASSWDVVQGKPLGSRSRNCDSAALGAITLRHCLGEQRRLRPNGELTRLSRRFQRRLARVTAVPWMFATSEDYRYRGTTGRPPGWGTSWMHRYLDQVVRLGTQDPRVRRTFLEAFHLLKPPAALFHPAILWRALRQTLARDGAERARAVEPDLATST